jgi:hypothetical protein
MLIRSVLYRVLQPAFRTRPAVRKQQLAYIDVNLVGGQWSLTQYSSIYKISLFFLSLRMEIWRKVNTTQLGKKYLVTRRNRTTVNFAELGPLPFPPTVGETKSCNSETLNQCLCCQQGNNSCTACMSAWTIASIGCQTRS